jgi:membrane protein DedA with SNARE-associated domain
VLVVGAVVVVVVLGLAFGTSLLPSALQDIVFRTPLAIVILVVGTVGLLLWIARRPTPPA